MLEQNIHKMNFLSPSHHIFMFKQQVTFKSEQLAYTWDEIILCQLNIALVVVFMCRGKVQLVGG